MEAKDLLKFGFAILAFGAAVFLALAGFNQPPQLSTEAWGTPQIGGVYAQLLPAPQWLYAGSSVPCIWEVHPKTTKTINSVSYGTPGSYTSCAQNSTDWLLWTCDSVSAVEGNVACQPLRVVQNENPGTSETFFNQNLTFSLASTRGIIFPGCGSADCIVSNPQSLSAGTYYIRNLQIDAAITVNSNVSIIAVESINLGATGSITITPANPPYTLSITTMNFTHDGAITGNGLAGPAPWVISNCWHYGDCSYYVPCCYGGGDGGTGATLNITAAHMSGSGAITLSAGTSGAGITADNGGAHCASSYNYCSASGGLGGNGGKLIFNPLVKTNFASTGAITLSATSGANAVCVRSTGSPAKLGGDAGNITGNFTYFNNTATVNALGGTGGSACTYGACANGGKGGTSNIVVSNNITCSLAMLTATGGAGGGGCSSGSNGVWNVAYCGNWTGMDWSRFSPAATTSAATCLSPTNASFVVPNATSNFTAYLQNISVNATQPANTTLLISFSKDNGSTWTWLSPDYYSFPFNSSNNGTPVLDTHRQGTDYPYNAKMRVIAFNNSSGIFSSPAIVNFNLTDMQANVSGQATPNGTVSTSTIFFSCNYSNSSGTPIEAATPYLYLDGVPYAMSFNSTSKTYYYQNTAILLAGPHYWQCSADKANYKYALGTNYSLNVSGFGIFLPTGQTSVKLACAFPTIEGMTPTGQKAGIGIFRIQNYNTTVLRNYTLFLNNTVPAGVSVYARCDQYKPPGLGLVGWNLLSQTTGYKGLLNVNSTNANAYCWLRMDCNNVIEGSYVPFDFIFTEE